jgi:hypothetical protein
VCVLALTLNACRTAPPNQAAGVIADVSTGAAVDVATSTAAPVHLLPGNMRVVNAGALRWSQEANPEPGMRDLCDDDDAIEMKLDCGALDEDRTLPGIVMNYKSWGLRAR